MGSISFGVLSGGLAIYTFVSAAPVFLPSVRENFGYPLAPASLLLSLPSFFLSISNPSQGAHKLLPRIVAPP